MTITSCRSAEPLYVLTLRNNPQAETLFRAWIKQHNIEHAVVSGNRMMLHDQRGFERFLVTWAHTVATLTIWDTWLRRHIYLD
jgi:uncharacterized protein with PIN domain